MSTDTKHGAGSHGAPHGLHRFLLIGKKKIFSYHLALYNVEAHAFQAIVTLSLADAVREAYLADLEKNKDKRVFYSLFSPDNFPLTDLKRGKTFKVQLERVIVKPDGSREFQKMLNGQPTEASCSPEDVRYFRKLGGLKYPAHLTYLLFGEDDEVHIAHQLAKKPNWDEVITLAEPRGIDPSFLSKVPDITVEAIEDPHGVVTESPLKKGQRYEAKINGVGTSIKFRAGRQGWWNHTSLNS
ncbi:hypothetical protein [Streptomyces sp. 891-h]|uniref:hypothetical protein n=1 Tax=Streptomyces sp. 891-h TaxID=2720714 RepID=UPI001FAB1A20|nr:hypothetical protein [Streptomyces sp. 891-h]UNZ21178.1 hypothetical protein HC362_32975 [Streptomyces sp. 891-h]